MPLLHPKDDLKERTPVWVALSEFYLDNELTDGDIERIAKVCANSPYSITELRGILASEVNPAFYQNLISMAGEWGGWSADFVQQRVLNEYRPIRAFLLRNIPSLYLSSHTWRAVEREVQALRKSNPR